MQKNNSQKLKLPQLRKAEEQKIKELIEAEERLRSEISAELHDNIGQLIVSSKLILQLQLDKTGESSDFTKQAIELLKEAYTAVQNISHNLNPGFIKEKGLIKSLRDLAKTINQTHKLKLGLRIYNAEELKNLPSNLSLSVYRIIQEHLTNILKHAKADTVNISVYATSHSLDFEIKDDGKGFDKKTVKKGIGISNIYNRAAIHHGMAYIASTPGEGCILSVCIPIN